MARDSYQMIIRIVIVGISIYPDWRDSHPTRHTTIPIAVHDQPLYAIFEETNPTPPVSRSMAQETREVSPPNKFRGGNPFAMRLAVQPKATSVTSAGTEVD
ncbi:hypothetical protein AAE478_006012 [Parahypoxylon ruwenzoriense]